MTTAARQERLMSVIEGPHLSEKAHMSAENNQVVFRVRTDATKAEIKAAVELLFDVTVEKVQVVRCKGKNKRFGMVRGRRSDWKKAYVRLSADSELDFLGAEMA